MTIDALNVQGTSDFNLEVIHLLQNKRKRDDGVYSFHDLISTKECAGRWGKKWVACVLSGIASDRATAPGFVVVLILKKRVPYNQHSCLFINSYIILAFPRLYI